MTYFRSDSRGIAIIINKPHNCLRAFCEDGDYAWVHVEIDNLKYTFVSVYYHPDANDSKRKSNGEDFHQFKFFEFQSSNWWRL